MEPLRASLFGFPQITLNGRPVHADRRKVLALLVYLLSSGKSYGRESLAAFFWPDNNDQQAQAYLRNAVWEIRRLLGDEWLELEGKSVRFRLEQGAWVDTWHFESLLEDKNPNLAALQEAVDLYRGDFLAGFSLRDSQEFDEWQTGRSEQLRPLYDRALEQLTVLYSQMGEFDAAVSIARRRVDQDPLNETAQRTLIELMGRSGQRTAAMRQFEICQTILRDELDLEPEQATFEIYRKVSSSEIAPPPSTEAPLFSTLFNAGNLPSATKTFIGRSTEMDHLARYLADPGCRLATLMGPGGAGKTSLALETARANESFFKDGVWFISLAPLQSRESILPAIIETLHIAQAGFGQSLSESALLGQVVDYLRGKELLLVLDNLEHLSGAAGLFHELLSQAAGIKILATSRERLNLPEEWVLEISGLPVPGFHTLGRIDDYEGVQLFVAASRRARGNFQPGDEDWPAIERICQMVGGLPLGLELAAYWVRALPCPEIATEMERTLDFLYSSQPGLPDRQRSLQATFDYSWSLLDERERTAFRRLSVFESGFDRTAAAQVAGVRLPMLVNLLDKSLIQREDANRFSLHPYLKQYALARLKENLDEYQHIQDWYSDYYLHQMVDWLEELKGSRQIQVFNTVRREQANILAAWNWAIQQQKIDLLRRSALGLALTFILRGAHAEALSVFEPALRLARKHDRVELRVLCLAVLRYVCGNLDLQEQYDDECVALFATMSDSPEKAYAQLLVSLGPGNLSPDQQIAYCVDSAAYLHSVGDDWGAGVATLALGDDLLFGMSRVSEAEQAYQRGMAFFTEKGNDWGRGLCLAGLGFAAHEREKPLDVCRLFEESNAIFERLGDHARVASHRYTMHTALLTLGRVKEARELLVTNLPVLEQLGRKDALASHQLIIVEIDKMHST